jgi:hypothetical protein
MKTRVKFRITAGTILALTATFTVLAAGCSSSAAATTAATTTTTTAPPATTTTTTTATQAFQRRGTNGTIAAVSGNLLIVDTTQGEVNVNLSASTTIEKTVTGNISDLALGNFITVTGTPDSNGNVTATAILLRPNFTQGQTQFPTQITPRTGSGTTRPTGNFPGGGIGRQMTAGTIAAINGNTITLDTTAQTTVTLTVTINSSTVFQKTETGTAADLTDGETVAITGDTDASGNINAASISIEPAGENFPQFPAGPGS